MLLNDAICLGREKQLWNSFRSEKRFNVNAASLQATAKPVAACTSRPWRSRNIWAFFDGRMSKRGHTTQI
jgi:hypothetical protein